MSHAAGVAVDVRVTETLRLDVTGPDGPGVVTITVERKSGQMTRLRIDAPTSVRIRRNDYHQHKQSASDSPALA